VAVPDVVFKLRGLLGDLADVLVLLVLELFELLGDELLVHAQLSLYFGLVVNYFALGVGDDVVHTDVYVLVVLFDPVLYLHQLFSALIHRLLPLHSSPRDLLPQIYDLASKVLFELSVLVSFVHLGLKVSCELLNLISKALLHLLDVP
jgi:hypothetical protein